MTWRLGCLGKQFFFHVNTQIIYWKFYIDTESDAIFERSSAHFPRLTRHFGHPSGNMWTNGVRWRVPPCEVQHPHLGGSFGHLSVLWKNLRFWLFGFQCERSNEKGKLPWNATVKENKSNTNQSIHLLRVSKFHLVNEIKTCNTSFNLKTISLYHVFFPSMTRSIHQGSDM